jgi:hypothetical protein
VCFSLNQQAKVLFYEPFDANILHEAGGWRSGEIRVKRNRPCVPRVSGISFEIDLELSERKIIGMNRPDKDGNC